MNADVFCSTGRAEPLPGTAKTGKIFLAIEHAHGWGHDVMDGDAFGPEITEQLASYLKRMGATVQLIRKAGREGQQRANTTVFIAFTEVGVVEKLMISDISQLWDIDISAPGRSGGEEVDHPVVLVCTHGKRDRCCALKGRPLAADLTCAFDGDIIWESSHTKGHRFAPSIITLPWGYSYGRLNSSAAIDMVRHLQRGELFIPGNRGRSCYTKVEQVAELAVATQLIESGEPVAMGALQATGNTVTHHDGRTWDVTLEEREVPGVISSCGDEPKTGKALVAQEITRVF